MILKMILKSFDFQCDFDFQITTSKMILSLILNHLYLGDLILILKSSTYDDFAFSGHKRVIWRYIYCWVCSLRGLLKMLIQMLMGIHEKSSL